MASAPEILIIDDDRHLREIVAALLNDEGYATATAPDAASALALLAHRQPALILLDLRLPEMDGWTFLEMYQQRPEPRAPVVVVTAAHVIQSLSERAERLGAAAVLAKPFDLDDLLELVAQHARRSQSVA